VTVGRQAMMACRWYTDPASIRIYFVTTRPSTVRYATYSTVIYTAYVVFFVINSLETSFC